MQNCEKKEDLFSVSDSIKKRFGEDYEIRIPEKKCPRIKIINVEEKLLTDKNEFIDKIIMQNAITTRGSKRKISIINQSG